MKKIKEKINLGLKTNKMVTIIKLSMIIGLIIFATIGLVYSTLGGTGILFLLFYLLLCCIVGIFIDSVTM